MAPRRNGLRRDEPVSLRRETARSQFSDEQLFVLSLFQVALLQGGHGVYVKLSADGASLRLKVYTDDDQYQDNLSPHDDIHYVIADFAKQLKVSPFWEELWSKFGIHSKPVKSEEVAGRVSPAAKKAGQTGP